VKWLLCTIILLQPWTPTAQTQTTTHQFGTTCWTRKGTRCSCSPLSMTVAHFSHNTVFLAIYVAKWMCVPQTVVLTRRKMDYPSRSVKVVAPQQQQRRQPQRRLLKHAKIIRFHITGTHPSEMTFYAQTLLRIQQHGVT